LLACQPWGMAVEGPNTDLAGLRTHSAAVGEGAPREEY
jgi:hypothetical protein